MIFVTKEIWTIEMWYQVLPLKWVCFWPWKEQCSLAACSKHWVTFQFLGKLWAASCVSTQLLTLYSVSYLWRVKGYGLFRDGACQERKGLWPFDVDSSFMKSHGASLQIQGSNWIKTFKVLSSYCSLNGKEIVSHSYLCISV